MQYDSLAAQFCRVCHKLCCLYGWQLHDLSAVCHGCLHFRQVVTVWPVSFVLCCPQALHFFWMFLPPFAALATCNTCCAATAWLPQDICRCSAIFISLCCWAWAAAAAVIAALASELNWCMLFAAPATAAAATTLAEAYTLSLKFFSIVGLVNLICWSGAT